MRQLSDDGAAFIARQEGAVPYWYRDQGGTWTLGIGHAGDPSVEFIDVATEDDLSRGRRLSDAEMWQLFRTDAARYIEAVDRLVTVDLTQRQFDMLVDFAFNWGIGAEGGFPATSVLRLVNAGDFAGVARELVDGASPSGRRYDKGLAGIRRRRQEEAAAFLEAAPVSETWHPRAHRATANKSGGEFIGVAPKIVLHTVEGKGSYSYNPSSYYGNPYWPHATIDGAGIHQHLPIDVNAFALANAPGGAETNRANAIQCEILWFAGEIADLPDDIMRHVADWVGWVAEQTGTPLDFAEFRGDGSYGEGAPQRFSAQEWLEFTGVCGHQHVPENDHWDPGAFPVDRLRALLGADPTNPDNPPEEDDMAVALPLFGDAPDGREGGLWMVFGVLRKRVHTTQVWDDFHRLGAKHIGDVDKESGGKLPVAMFDGTIDIEKALVAARIAGTTEGASVDALADAVLREMYERLAS